LKPPTHYTTHCPECRARVRLPLVIRELGTDHAMPGNMALNVSVDPTPLRDHMKKVHGIGLVDSTTPKESM
jgi:hypothetical protein